MGWGKGRGPHAYVGIRHEWETVKRHVMGRGTEVQPQGRTTTFRIHNTRAGV